MKEANLLSREFLPHFCGPLEKDFFYHLQMKKLEKPFINCEFTMLVNLRCSDKLYSRYKGKFRMVKINLDCKRQKKLQSFVL